MNASLNKSEAVCLSTQPIVSTLEMRAMSAWKRYEKGYYINFYMVEEATGLTYKEIKSAVAGLRKKGLLKFAKGLIGEEGVAGSGYSVTDEGEKFIKRYFFDSDNRMRGLPPKGKPRSNRLFSWLFSAS